MSTALKERLLIVLCLFAGAMDTTSGALLMLFPEFTLKLMSVPPVAETAWVFIRFIGAFVFSVGSLYLFSLLPVLTVRHWNWVGGVLLVTAWVRTVICLFTTVAIFSEALNLAWWSVPLTDGALAVVQVYLVAKGWVTRNG